MALGASVTGITTGAILDSVERDQQHDCSKGDRGRASHGCNGHDPVQRGCAHAVEVYQGSTPAWVSLGASATATSCAGPDAFSFTNQTDVAVKYRITPNTVTWTGASWLARRRRFARTARHHQEWHAAGDERELCRRHNRDPPNLIEQLWHHDNGKCGRGAVSVRQLGRDDDG